MERTEFLTATVDQIDTAYQRAVEAVRRIGDPGFAAISLSPADHRQLAQRGHFLEYGHELDWTAREIGGHLSDSATVFGARIKVIREMDNPSFGDFVTDEPERIERYRAFTLSALIDRMVWTHQYLRSQIDAIGDDDIDRMGVHEHDGEMSIRYVLDFLPDHIADHVAHLRALASSSSHA